MIIQSAAVLEAVKARPGNAGVRLYGRATADLDSLCARRPPKSWSGRKKACGAVEQKKATKQERKRLAPLCEKGLDNVPPLRTSASEIMVGAEESLRRVYCGPVLR